MSKRKGADLTAKTGRNTVAKPRAKVRRYHFKIDAYFPETMPLGRLAEYLADLSVLLGESQGVHLIEIERGSCSAALLVDREAEPKILENVDAVVRREAPPERIRALESINERLRKDNATGEFLAPTGDNLIVFPGRERVEPQTYGPISQPGVIIGIPIVVGGENDPVPVHIEGREDDFNCLAHRDMARDIATHLFRDVIRAEGMGRWVRRPSGEWEMIKFMIRNFKPLANVTLRDAIQDLRALPAAWKEKEDPLGELMDIRHGTDG